MQTHASYRLGDTLDTRSREPETTNILLQPAQDNTKQHVLHVDHVRDVVDRHFHVSFV